MNKNMKKFLTGSVTAALVATAIAPAASAAFQDVPSNDTHVDNINKAAELGLINGKDGNFMPYQDITRGQVAKIIARYLEQNGDVDTIGVEQFDDVNASSDTELKEAALVVRAAEVFKGSDGKLNFAKNITRQEMATVLVRLFGLEDLAEVESEVTDIETAWETHRTNIEILSENGVTAVSEFNPLGNVKRAQFASFMIRAIDLATPDEEVVAFNSGFAGFIVAGDKAVANATVTVGEETATTDANGYYELLNVEPGEQEITIEAEGYKTITAKETVLEEEVSSFNQDIAAAKINTANITVSGMIVDSETGAAINGATVTLESYDEEAEAWVAVATVQSNATGAYNIDQNAATTDLELDAKYRQTVSKVDYKVFVQTITLDDQEVENKLAGIEIDAIAAMDITGTVTNAAGEKVSGATVTIFDEEGTQVGTATTSTEGLYTVTDAKLVDGTYNVVVNDNTSAVSYTEFDVEEGTDATHNVQLQAGYAIDATIGTELLNDVFGAVNADTAMYSLELVSGNTVIAKDTFTGVEANNDAKLDFDFARVAPGEYTLKLTGDYVVTEEFKITVDGNETFEGRAMPAGKITGTVNAGATVDLVNTTGNVVATVEAGDNGAYVFNGVQEGNYSVNVTKENFVSGTVKDVAVVKNTVTEGKDLTLAAVVTSGNVSGVARVSGSLAAAKDATITYYNKDGVEVQTATVNEAGAYALSGLVAGTYDVVVRGNGIETYTTTQTIEAGKNLENINFNLTAGGEASLKISVVDSEGNPVAVAQNGFDLLDAFVEVDADNNSKGVSEFANTTTDTVTINNLSAGTYNLEIDVLDEKYVDVETTATLAAGEAGELVITVEEKAAQRDVNFLVVNEANVNVADAKVVVFNEDGSIKTALNTTAGTADLALVDGNYTIAVIKDGYVVEARDLKVAGKDVTIPVIQLSPIK